MRPLHVKLTAARKAAKLTLDDVAKAMGVTRSGAGHWFTGESKPRMDKLKALAALLNVSVSSLVDEDPEYAVDAREKEILQVFRSLSPDQQDLALRIINNLNKV